MLTAAFVGLVQLLAFVAAIDIDMLTIVPCQANAADACLVTNSVTTNGGGQFLLMRGAQYTCGSSQHNRMFKWIVRDELMSVSWCANGVPRLSVLDPRRATQGELAYASIGAVKTAITVLIKAPSSGVVFDAAFNVSAAAASASSHLRLPVLVLGYETELSAASSLCVFDPRSLAVSPQCGAGFRAVSLSGIVAPASVGYNALFREVGAIAHDANGDGWSEVVLFFHATQATINVAPGASAPLFRQLSYDVGAKDGATVSVHSGRNYGIWAARVAGTTSGTFAELGIGGVGVGEFSDHNCNVSRFVAMLGALGLMWSHYYGFASSIWNNYDASQCGGVASGGLACLSRPGDFDNKCIHRFEHGIGKSDDGVDFVAFNYWTQTSPTPTDNSARCLAEQYNLYQPETWTKAKTDAWNACFARKHTESRGFWGVAFRKLWSGEGYTGGTNVYAWGTARNLTGLGGSNTFLVLEVQPSGSAPVDLSLSTAPAMQVKTLKGGLFQHVGTFPVPGRPKIRRAFPTDDDIDSLTPDWNIGFASGTSMSVLTMRDVNCDGSSEIMLETNQWVGWSSAGSGAFVLVEPKQCAGVMTLTLLPTLTIPSLVETSTLDMPMPTSAQVSGTEPSGSTTKTFALIGDSNATTSSFKTTDIPLISSAAILSTVTLDFLLFWAFAFIAFD
jgi:hypothetical protein